MCRTDERKLELFYQGLFHPLGVPAMTFLVRWHFNDHFRWYHSGDFLCGAPHKKSSHRQPNADGTLVKISIDSQVPRAYHFGCSPKSIPANLSSSEQFPCFRTTPTKDA